MTTKNNPWLRRLGKFLLGTVVLIGLLLLAGTVYQTVGAWSDHRNLPPPGQLVPVGETHLHLNCRGEGSPTVILEALSGGFSPYWAWIQPQVAQSTRVCSYDRAGRGWSDANVPPADLWASAENLHTLLQNAGIAGPYVLVGHSIGGLYTRAFAAQYPDEVAGLMLLDASHPEEFDRYPEYAAENESYLKIASLLPIAAGLGVNRLYFAAGGEFDFAELPPHEHDTLAAAWSSPAYFENQIAEIQAGPQIYNQAHDLGNLGDLPLVVISAGGSTGNGWADLQAELAALSTNSTHSIIQDATHTSLVFNEGHAQQVSQAILQLVETVRQ